jgi:hypothetical protein
MILKHVDLGALGYAFWAVISDGVTLEKFRYYNGSVNSPQYKELCLQKALEYISNRDTVNL